MKIFKTTTLSCPNALMKAMVLSLLTSFATMAYAGDVTQTISEKRIDQAIKRVMTHYPSLPKKWVRDTVYQSNFNSKVIRLINRSTEKRLNWEQYREIFMTTKRVTVGHKFYKKHKAWLVEAEQKYKVSRWVILSIMGVETYYGRILGSIPVLDALVTLSAHPESRRYKFFNAQLADFLLLVHQHKLRLDETGSYAGAMGIGQFIPTSIRRWAVDGDGDQWIDLRTSNKDAIYSIANYLKDHDWVPNKGIAKRATAQTPNAIAYELNDGKEWWLPLENFRTIKTYNRSNLYALAVDSLAKALEQKERDQ